jgi:hypothetical protein
MVGAEVVIDSDVVLVPVGIVAITVRSVLTLNSAKPTMPGDV